MPPSLCLFSESSVRLSTLPTLATGFLLSALALLMVLKPSES